MGAANASRWGAIAYCWCVVLPWLPCITKNLLPSGHAASMSCCNVPRPAAATHNHVR